MIGGEMGQLYRDGEVIFREGEVGNAMYVIQFGEVSITKQTADGEVVLAVLAKGEVLGEMALFDKQRRSATATARGDARVLYVDKKKFFASISRDPTLAFNILRSLSQRVRKLNDEVIRLKRPD